MKSSTWVIALVGLVLAGGIALFLLNQPVKNDRGEDCGTALSHEPRFAVSSSAGLEVPNGPDLCAGVGDSNGTLAGIAGGTILLLTVVIVAFDYTRRRDTPAARTTTDVGSA